MSDMFQFDLVSPEQRLASFGATAVRLPAAEGEMTVMAGHAPVISTLRPGVVRIEGGESGEYVITGGFVEIGEGGVAVLAERAWRRGDDWRGDVQAVLDQVSAGRDSAAPAGDGDRDATDLLIADLGALLKKTSA